MREKKICNQAVGLGVADKEDYKTIMDSCELLGNSVVSDCEGDVNGIHLHLLKSRFSVQETHRALANLCYLFGYHTQ